MGSLSWTGLGKQTDFRFSLCSCALGSRFLFSCAEKKVFLLFAFFLGGQKIVCFLRKASFFAFYEKKVFLLFAKRKFFCFSFFLTWINNVPFYMEKQVLVNFKKQSLFILQKQLTIRGPINPYDGIDTNWYPQPVVASINLLWFSKVRHNYEVQACHLKYYEKYFLLKCSSTNVELVKFYNVWQF